MHAPTGGIRRNGARERGVLRYRGLGHSSSTFGPKYLWLVGILSLRSTQCRLVFDRIPGSRYIPSLHTACFHRECIFVLSQNSTVYGTVFWPKMVLFMVLCFGPKWYSLWCCVLAQNGTLYGTVFWPKMVPGTLYCSVFWTKMVPFMALCFGPKWYSLWCCVLAQNGTLYGTVFWPKMVLFMVMCFWVRCGALKPVEDCGPVLDTT